MKFKEEIERSDLVDKVTNSQSLYPNINYKRFGDTLIKAKQNNLPVKKKKINKQKHHGWMEITMDYICYCKVD